MEDKLTEETQEAYMRAAASAREAAAKAREAAQAYDLLAEQLLAGQVVEASNTHYEATRKFAQASDAASTCEEWLTQSGDPA
ncbi:MAG TPA: hypothetical protein VGO91_10295 [Pyrinomonadaceae bacterium]|jgi:hypothetical protein|nr:hypothetical protein [Pyrinomonadaceae bacterium]